jgi:methyl-accepting chemotaxis protein
MGVIAEQIRTLAEDAAKGTEQIAQTLDSSALHIEQVQAAIERVAHIAAEVLHYQGAIATAAEQQAAVVADIAQRAHVAQQVALAATAHVGPAL